MEGTARRIVITSSIIALVLLQELEGRKRRGCDADAGHARHERGIVIALLLGKKFGPYIGITVGLEDVARAHVASLDPAVLGSQSYILGGAAQWTMRARSRRGGVPTLLKTNF
ncbi:hypothetical protein B0T25DRAFT_574495 [Lasiosphaeria hispida]|uniref:Uncharacterized protein n=1 Tax=Lasiosphaeria hispida TaxID=260671 RepID=A0AAJ0M8Z6_9PEZI|nr:hypothetical protein B0T25DRAFT_574495 [Lasiosphaeria hispida]